MAGRGRVFPVITEVGRGIYAHSPRGRYRGPRGRLAQSKGGWENSLAFSFPEPPNAKRRHRLRLCLAERGKPGGMGLLGSPDHPDVQAPMLPGQRA